MGRIAIGLKIENGKVEAKSEVKEAVLSELSQAYAQLEIIQQNILSYIQKGSNIVEKKK